MPILLRAPAALLCCLLIHGAAHAEEPDTWVVQHGEALQEAPLSHAAGKHFRLKPRPQLWNQLVRRVPALALALEETPAIRVKASEAGVQFRARVVLPRSIDRATGIPHTVVLDGDSTARPHEWCHLRLQDPDVQLARQVRILRTRYGEVDAREAYVDLLILKALGNETGTPLEIWVAEPDLAAHALRGFGVDLSDPVGDHARPQRARHESAQLEVDGRLFLPRVVRSNGETWEFLKGLGFNTIAINAPPTLAQHERAKRLGLWLVAPPPAKEMPLDAIPFDRVIAWNLTDIETPPHTRYHRPTLSRAGGRTVAADILLHRRHPLGTRTELVQYGEWLANCCRNAQGNWVAIQTELPGPLVRQATALGADSDRIAPQPEQIRALVLAGVTAGCRGFWFDSRHRLDGRTEATRSRAAAIILANAMLSKAQPWIVAGGTPSRVACRSADFKAVALRLPRATLVILNGLPRGGQRGIPAAANSIDLTIPGVATLSHAWRLESDGLKRVPLRRVPGGAQLQLVGADSSQLIALTRDMLVLENLNQATRTWDQRVKQAEAELTELPRPEQALADVDPLQSLPAEMHWAARTKLVGYQQPLGRQAMTVELLQHGDFERGGALRALGWQMGCQQACRGTVTISPEGARSGLHGLKLYCPESSAAAEHQPLVWVLTPPVHLAPHQPVRIEGHVRIPVPLQGGRLLISDSLGKETLRIEVSETDGWARFSMLRAALESESLQLSFALTGPGTVFLDDLQITPIIAR